MEKKENFKKCPACKKGKVEKISFDEFIDEITDGKGEQIKKDLKKIRRNKKLKNNSNGKKDLTEPCIKCGSKNVKMIREGLETDLYKCKNCGEEYGVTDLDRF